MSQLHPKMLKNVVFTHVYVWVLGVGCWVLGVGCWVLGVGCWVKKVFSELTYQYTNTEHGIRD